MVPAVARPPTALPLAKGAVVTRAQELHAKADHFAERAAQARGRTARNTYLSLEQSYRSLATQQERFETAGLKLSTAVALGGPGQGHDRQEGKNA